ncbi:hypothetical protein N7535_004738 [Penicillium sp. DV-2018c]|nr:hypothetical protein N7461_008321 [Penicillium sp. DV-2018c]KAJ5571078.1 hypothetical protein N7535_004738 [Penicillium sp. DV-2018c]
MTSTTSLPSVTTKTVSRPAPNGMGRGLFATTNINPGEDVVHIKTSFVAVLNSLSLHVVCAGCFGKRSTDKLRDFESQALKACAGCRVVKYCDRACQSKDWKAGHSFECPIFKRLQPRVLPINARAILRIVARIARNKYDSEELKMFEGLQSHMKEFAATGQLDRMTLTAAAVKTYSGTAVDEAKIANYAAILDTNGFNLNTFTYDLIGLYLHPYVALINHSCDYNSIVGFEGEELYLKAMRPIKKGEQIFIQYIDTTAPRDVRRSELKQRYFFDCQCTKCANESETLAGGFLSTPKDMEAIRVAEQEARKLLDDSTLTESDVNLHGSIEKLEAAMRRLRETGVWPLTRQPYATCRDELIATAMLAGRFTLAFIHAAIRFMRVDPFIYDKNHPVRQVHAWSLVETMETFLEQGFVQSDPKDPVRVEDFQLDFLYILWAILAELVNTQSESCTMLSFKRLAGSHFVDIHNQIKTDRGVDLTNNRGLLYAELQKLQGFVHKALEKEPTGPTAPGR